jgi:hypothetical protein
VNNGLFLFFEGSPKLKDYAMQLRKLAKLSVYEQIFASHSVKPLPFSIIGYYADFLECATLKNSKITDIPCGNGDVWKYSENGKMYGLKEIAVHYTEDSLD